MGMMSGASLLFITVTLTIVVALLAAIVDARTGHIPNWLTLGALVIAPVLAFARGGLAMAGMSLLGAVICGIGPLVAFFRGGLGGGDVKLLAAIGALLGPRYGLDAEVCGFVIGALYVPARLAWQGRLGETITGLLRTLKNPFVAKSARVELPETLRMKIRLGPAIFTGTLFIALVTRMST
jgi:prepilin peptidase CpaA